MLRLPEPDFERYEDLDEVINDVKVTGFKYKDWVAFALYESKTYLSLKFKIYGTDLYDRMDRDDQRLYGRYIKLNFENNRLRKEHIVKIEQLCEDLFNKYSQK